MTMVNNDDDNDDLLIYVHKFFSLPLSIPSILLPSIHRSRAVALFERCWHTKQTTTNPLSLVYNSFNAATNQLSMQMAQCSAYCLTFLHLVCDENRAADRTSNRTGNSKKQEKERGWPAWVDNFEPSNYCREFHIANVFWAFFKSYMEGSPRTVHSCTHRIYWMLLFLLLACMASASC